MNELYHHGVLGMKWGIRRYQPFPKGKHGTFLNQDRDNDIIIKKGTEAYRLQTGNKLTGEGHTYVSFNKLDSLKYASITAGSDWGGLDVNMRDGSGRILTLKITNDIIAPSYQKTMDAFIKTVDSIGVKEVAKEIYSDDHKQWYDNIKKEKKEFIKKYKHLTVDECRDSAYETFTKMLMRDTKSRRMFFNILKENGYNAIVDENDKHFGRFKETDTNSPLIVFDKKKNVKVSNTMKINDKDAEYFHDLYYQDFPDRDYLVKTHGKTVNKWDKWAGTINRL